MKQHQIHDNRAAPNGWHKIRLGDVVELNCRYWSPADGAQILYLDLTSVVRPGRLATPKELAAAEAPGRARRRVESGNVLVSTVRPNLRGFARVQRAADNLIASTGFAVLSPRSEVDGSYIYHHVMTGQFAEYLENAATGQAYPAVRPDDIKGFPLLLPPLSEQRSIGAVLDSIDEATEQTEAVIATLEDLRDALLQELLTRGIPGQHSVWQYVPGIGQIPSEWEVVRLEDVAQVNPKRPSLDVPPERPVTFLPMAAVDENAAGIVTRELRAFRDVAKGYTYFEENDVLFAKITPCLQNGKHTLATGLVGQFGFGTTEFHVVRAGDKIEPGHLFRVLTRPANIEKCVRSFSGTAGQQRVHPEILKALPVSLPPLPEQKVISTTLDSVDQRIAWARNELQELESAKEALADALLTGRVRIVPDEPSTGSRIHARQ